MHSDNARSAILITPTYVMEAGVAEDVAREQVCRAFQLVVHVSRERMGRRVISEITEVEPVLEGNQQRFIELYKFDRGLRAVQHDVPPIESAHPPPRPL